MGNVADDVKAVLGLCDVRFPGQEEPRGIMARLRAWWCRRFGHEWHYHIPDELATVKWTCGRCGAIAWEIDERTGRVVWETKLEHDVAIMRARLEFQLCMALDWPELAKGAKDFVDKVGQVVDVVWPAQKAIEALSKKGA